jgi:hypothetical protein
VTDGSSTRICRPPGPVTIPLRNVRPATRSRSTSAAMSSTMRWMRFQPPGAGMRPSDIGRPAELLGPLSKSRRLARTTSANAGPGLVRSVKSKMGSEEVDRLVDVVDHVADVDELVRHVGSSPRCSWTVRSRCAPTRQPSRIVKSSRARRSGSVMKSSSTILSPRTVIAPIENGSPSRSAIPPTAPLIRTGWMTSCNCE